MKRHLFLGIITVAVIAATSVPGAAYASASPSATDAVARAEGMMGLDDDIDPAKPLVAVPGERVAVGDSAAGVAVATDARAASSRAPAYTVDRLDPETTRLAAVLTTAGQTASWDFGPDTELFVLADGRVSVSDEDGEFLAGIAAPWAVDSHGVRLATRYVVDGSRLVQEVTTRRDTVYPVVADPTIKTYVGYYQITFTKSESFTVVGTVGSCTALLAKAPHPAMRALMVGCGVFAAFSAAQLSGGKCIRAHIVGFPPTIGTWWPTFPKC
ncbi:hypothetical protein EDF46_2315 [Frondihabitans sp. PhB188]|uniref:hypothetical protein n=1 Tax=Frondihabitans sp. PhB188 TaxID=2485200 RepID=UPI000F471B86|nr:hypothetical protein [Frondihabitans sp. PhB188]ROQ38674.1 hypothetical protein EDF46_2315 [Frondihabitans sp. PhB188]